MRPPAERAGTLRAFGAQIERDAGDGDARARCESAAQAVDQAAKSARRSAAAQRRLQQARAELAAANAADIAAREAFHREPGAHALFQRFEYEAELFEALEAFKVRVEDAKRARAHKPFVLENCSPSFAIVQDVVCAAAGRERK